MKAESSTTNGALDDAFSQLSRYATGSSRGGLVPIDEALGQALDDAPLRATLEQRLLSQLSGSPSVEAGYYICDKLRFIGSSAAVPVLAKLLTDPALGDIARGTLEVLPAVEVSGALRRALPKLEGPGKIGVIHALGRQADPENVPVLARLSNDTDVAVAAAAAAALGNLGSLRAAEAFRRLLDQPRPELRLAIGQAALDCAAGLLKIGHPSEAKAIYRTLTESGWPEVVVRAARHGLESISS
jgi:HEAT repeat protein